MIQDYVPVPWTIWDLETNTQLNGAFLENDVSPNQDGTWNPDESALGGRELIGVMDSAYSGDGTPDLDYFNDPDLRDALNGLVDFRYAMWPRRIAAGAPIDDGDRFRFTWGGIVPSPGVDARLFALAALDPGDPSAVTGYGQVADCLSDVNFGIGIGPTCGGPTPTLLSLVGTEIGHDRVTVTWYAAGSASRVQVERREDLGDWTSMGEVLPDGRGLIVFEDRSVSPGHEYAYRVRWAGAVGSPWEGETTVLLPLRDALSLEGFHPHPAGRASQLAFTLASSAPATLTVFDVAGRRRFTREVGTLGPGPHVIPLDRGESLTSGIYVLHLTQAGRTVTRRAVAIR